MMNIYGPMFLILFSCSLFAQEKYLAVMGAGGEPKTSGTIFDQGLKSMGDFVKKNSHYKLDLHFNGGHTTTEQIAREKFSHFDESNYFTAKSFEETIKNYEDLIQSGKITSKDQILIHINTHGSEKVDLTHQISTSEGAITDYNTLGSKATVSLDRLKKLTDLAQTKGVKLAIVDLSCHSGNTLSLANSKTCVISGTGSKHFGFGGSYEGTFSNRFNNLLEKGKSLEEVYLAARADHFDLSFPMISTPGGIEAQSKLYDPVTPFLYFYMAKADKFIPFIEEDFFKKNGCLIDEQHLALINQTQSLISTVKNESTKDAVREFQRAVSEYYSFIDDLKEQMAKSGYTVMKNRLSFCSSILADPKQNIKEGKECVNYFTLEQILTLNFDQIFKYYTERLKEGTPEDKAHMMAILESYKKAKTWKEHIIKENPYYAQISTFWSSWPQLEAKTQQLARSVNKAQQKVYLELYNRTKSSAPNPCRDFIL
jgi:hypothetical protein